MNDLVRAWFVAMFVSGMTGLAVGLVASLLWIHFREKRERLRDEQYRTQRLQRTGTTPLQV